MNKVSSFGDYCWRLDHHHDARFDHLLELLFESSLLFFGAKTDTLQRNRWRSRFRTWYTKQKGWLERLHRHISHHVSSRCWSFLNFFEGISPALLWSRLWLIRQFSWKPKIITPPTSEPNGTTTVDEKGCITTKQRKTKEHTRKSVGNTVEEQRFQTVLGTQLRLLSREWR